MRKILIITAITIVLIGCSNENTDEFILSDYPITLDLTTAIDSNFWESFDIIETIPLETKEHCLIGDIHKVTETHKGFFIFDIMNQQLLHFNMDGSFNKRIGRKGKGPGEYGDIRDYDIDTANGLINVLSFRKIFQYDIESGDLVSELRLKFYSDRYNPFALTSLGTDDFVFVNRFYEGNEQPDQVEHPLIFRASSRRVLEIFLHSADHWSLHPIFYQSSPKTYITTTATSNCVYRLNNNKLDSTYLLDFGKLGIKNDIQIRGVTRFEIDDMIPKDVYRTFTGFHSIGESVYFVCIGPGSYRYEFLLAKTQGKAFMNRWNYFYPIVISANEETGSMLCYIENSAIYTALKGSQDGMQIPSILSKLIGVLPEDFSEYNNPCLFKVKARKHE